MLEAFKTESEAGNLDQRLVDRINKKMEDGEYHDIEVEPIPEVVVIENEVVERVPNMPY